jgi:hypothetical protein
MNTKSEYADTWPDKDPWTLEQIISDAKEDDDFWKSPDFDLRAYDIARLYTQKRSLVKRVIDSQDIIQEQAKEIQRLTNLLDRQSYSPLDMVAGGPGSPGYDEEIILDNTLRELEATDIEYPVIEEWRLPEKDR